MLGPCTYLYGACIVERTDLYSLFTYSNDRLWCRVGSGAVVDDEGWPRGHFNTRRSSATLKMPFLPWILRDFPYLEGGALLLPYITQPLFIMYRQKSEGRSRNLRVNFQFSMSNSAFLGNMMPCHIS